MLKHLGRGFQGQEIKNSGKQDRDTAAWPVKLVLIDLSPNVETEFTKC